MIPSQSFVCEVCGGIACLGFGRQNGKFGNWYCWSCAYREGLVDKPDPTPRPNDASQARARTSATRANGEGAS